VRIKFHLYNILSELICIWNDVYEIHADTFLEGAFVYTPSFLVYARLTTCVHAHILEGTLLVL